MSELVYTFDDSDDARAYLREVSTVWVVWITALVGLLMRNGIVVIVWGVVAIAALVLVVRPLMRRAEQLVPENKVEDGGMLKTALQGGTTRDRAIRDLFYGTEPLRAAYAAAGMSERWIVLRHFVVILTIFAVVYVLFGTI